MKDEAISKKDRRRSQLVLAMLQHPSLEKAAASIGVSPVTAWRISKTPEFAREYREARKDCYSQATARLQQASNAAATVLLNVVVDPQAPASSRVRAASKIIDLTLRAIERDDIEARLSALEQAVAAFGSGSR